jgi:hypothetical protein
MLLPHPPHAVGSGNSDGNGLAPGQGDDSAGDSNDDGEPENKNDDGSNLSSSETDDEGDDPPGSQARSKGKGGKSKSKTNKQPSFASLAREVLHLMTRRAQRREGLGCSTILDMFRELPRRDGWPQLQTAERVQETLLSIIKTLMVNRNRSHDVQLKEFWNRHVQTDGISASQSNGAVVSLPASAPAPAPAPAAAPAAAQAQARALKLEQIGKLLKATLEGILQKVQQPATRSRIAVRLSDHERAKNVQVLSPSLMSTINQSTHLMELLYCAICAKHVKIDMTEKLYSSAKDWGH